MSAIIAPYPIRLFCDQVSPSNLQDLNRGSQPPGFYRGDDIEIDIGIGQNGNLLTPLAGSGAGGIASVTAELFQSENDTNNPMMSCTVLAANMNLALTQASWNVGGSANSHASFIFPNSQTAVNLNGLASVNYWLRIIAQTTDTTPKSITLLDGPITVRDGPIPSLSIAPGGQFRTYSVNGQIVPQLLDTTTGLYHTLAIFNDSGVLTLQVSDQGY
jgi:hypothetical protein